MISFWLSFDPFHSPQSWLCSPIFLLCLFQLATKAEHSQISTLTLLKLILNFTLGIYNFLSHKLIKNSIYKTKKDLSLQTVFVTDELGFSWLKAYMCFLGLIIDNATDFTCRLQGWSCPCHLGGRAQSQHWSHWRKLQPRAQVPRPSCFLHICNGSWGTIIPRSLYLRLWAKVFLGNLCWGLFQR